jgi:hypothetical protein
MVRSIVSGTVARSVGAVVVGFVFIAALSFGADAVIRVSLPHAYGADGSIASTAVLLASLVYMAIFAITGCYLAARLASHRPMEHALVLGALGLAFTVIAVIGMRGSLPLWYGAVSVLTVFPYAWLGGRLREVEMAREARELESDEARLAQVVAHDRSLSRPPGFTAKRRARAARTQRAHAPPATPGAARAGEATGPR